MLDQIESWELAAEKQFDKMDLGNGKLKCDCGKIFDIGDGGTTSPNPYAIPVCPDCLEEWMQGFDKNQGDI